MKVFLIRLKNSSNSCKWYIGKRSPSYALSSDEDININRTATYYTERGRKVSAYDVLMQNNLEQNPPYWFVKRERAKVWVDAKALRSFVNHYNKGKTHSEYEVEIDDGKVITIPLDEFVKTS